MAHFDSTAPTLGEAAPAFTLQDLDGNTVELEALVGEKPIVLQFGSHSCPVYRYRRFSMSGLYEDYRERVHFLMVYTIEAHPVGSKSPYDEGEWDIWWNKVAGVRVQQPETEEERQEIAAFSQQKLELEPVMVVDDLDNSVWQTYGAASSPAFVIDLEGRIAARQVWVEPKRVREILDRLLRE